VAVVALHRRERHQVASRGATEVSHAALLTPSARALNTACKRTVMTDLVLSGHDLSPLVVAALHDLLGEAAWVAALVVAPRVRAALYELFAVSAGAQQATVTGKGAAVKNGPSHGAAEAASARPRSACASSLAPLPAIAIGHGLLSDGGSRLGGFLLRTQDASGQRLERRAEATRPPHQLPTVASASGGAAAEDGRLRNHADRAVNAERLRSPVGPLRGHVPALSRYRLRPELLLTPWQGPSAPRAERRARGPSAASPPPAAVLAQRNGTAEDTAAGPWLVRPRVAAG
jgi:hypothetical protein